MDARLRSIALRAAISSTSLRNGFVKELDCAGFHGTNRGRHVAVTRDEDDRDVDSVGQLPLQPVPRPNLLQTPDRPTDWAEDGLR